MNKTFIPNYKFDKKQWYVINCKNEHLGRVSSYIVPLLIGKVKPYYFPSLDMGNYVILINVEHMLLSDKKNRMHVFSPGRPGTSLKLIKNTNYQQIVNSCIRKMLPNGNTKRHIFNRLKIYKDSHHPHISQNPIYISDIKNI
jgi:large subunit ribosomal protein L13